MQSSSRQTINNYQRTSGFSSLAGAILIYVHTSFKLKANGIFALPPNIFDRLLLILIRSKLNFVCIFNYFIQTFHSVICHFKITILHILFHFSMIFCGSRQNTEKLLYADFRSLQFKHLISNKFSNWRQIYFSRFFRLFLSCPSGQPLFNWGLSDYKQAVVCNQALNLYFLDLKEFKNYESPNVYRNINHFPGWSDLRHRPCKAEFWKLSFCRK